ncbi:hypothetical protein EYZ11_003652 [Aspergillus tanneri]|uniref:Uncharacterized protein n=1 Tax=Aspergillus tanneri TaxID=1220188 RepID=A0A4S3JMT4_9EURO|nr:hypothetical protein EYZ11_003652 [Aspergillus tanneri]
MLRETAFATFKCSRSQAINQLDSAILLKMHYHGHCDVQMALDEILDDLRTSRKRFDAREWKRLAVDLAVFPTIFGGECQDYFVIYSYIIPI